MQNTDGRPMARFLNSSVARYIFKLRLQQTITVFENFRHTKPLILKKHHVPDNKIGYSELISKFQKHLREMKTKS